MCFTTNIIGMKKNNKNKIAIVAGALDLPILTRDALRRAGWDVFVIGLKNFYDEKLNPDSAWGGWACNTYGAKIGHKKSYIRWRDWASKSFGFAPRFMDIVRTFKNVKTSTGV